MSVAGIALVAAVAALVLMIAFVQVGRRARRASEDRVADALAIMGERMDALARELHAALRRVDSEGHRSRALHDLGHLHDMDEILARAVEAAATLPGVEAAVARTGTADGTTVLAAVGMPAEVAEEEVFQGFSETRVVRAVQVLYRRGPENGLHPRDATRVAVPLAGGGAEEGFLAVFMHGPETDFPRVVAELETIARAAAPAIVESRSRRGAPGSVDVLTGLYNRETFYETLLHEVARAHGGARPLSLLALDLDGFRALNAEIGQLEGDVVLREVAARVRECMPPPAVACRIGGDEFAVVLPDTRRPEAERLFAAIQARLLRQPLDRAPSVTLSGGIAELTREDDAVSLYYRAEAALQQAKASGKGTTA